jgi:hypothetical protein
VKQQMLAALKLVPDTARHWDVVLFSAIKAAIAAAEQEQSA